MPKKKSVPLRPLNKLSIVIPAYNEERTIREILRQVSEIGLRQMKKEIVVINDGSKDNTLKLAQAEATELVDNHTSFKILSNDKNMGKSQSVKKGILETTGDLVVIQDADLEYEPQELQTFINLFKEDPELDVVYGNRFGKKNKVVYWQNWFGNRFLTFISNLFTVRNGFWVKDMEVCYKMVRGDVMREIATTIASRSNFGIEPEITAKLAKFRWHENNGKVRKLKLKQLPITYRPRTIAEGKHMKAYRDGIKALGEIIKFNL